MTQTDTIKERQRDWATKLGFKVEPRAYLPHYAENLFQPLSPTTRASFEQGDGGELVPQLDRPPKMAALHSSSALAVNVFDYWTEQLDKSPLELTLALTVPILKIEFEVKYPTGLMGNSPNLDVVLRLQSCTTVGIESKFTEWLTPKPPNKELFKPKYFPTGEGLWAERGLKRCQELANDIAAGRESFRYLDAAQLLKHALGLWTSSDRASLFYIYYDCPSSVGEQHQLEIERFCSRVGSEIGFYSLAYQDLYRRLVETCDCTHSDYLTYLAQRYFSAVPL